MFAHSEVVHSIRCVVFRTPLVIETLFDSQAALLEHCIVRRIGRVASNFEATPTEKKSRSRVSEVSITNVFRRQP
jgi:hypothetical protein